MPAIYFMSQPKSHPLTAHSFPPTSAAPLLSFLPSSLPSTLQPPQAQALWIPSTLLPAPHTARAPPTPQQRPDPTTAIAIMAHLLGSLRHSAMYSTPPAPPAPLTALPAAARGTIPPGGPVGQPILPSAAWAAAVTMAHR
jgi:hypothetical protein